MKLKLLSLVGALTCAGAVAMSLPLSALRLGAAEAAPVAPMRASHFSVDARVVAVLDGDTVDVTLLASSKRQRVRLIGIESPERGQCFARAATRAAHKLALAQRVRLIGDRTQAKQDRYGRLLAYVVLPNGNDLARLLIGRGFGVVYVYDRLFNRVGAYRTAEAAAKARRVGLWSACGTPADPATAPTPPPPSPRPTNNCDPSYPDVCIPSPPPDLDCKDVPYENFRVLPPDPHRFDGNKDGRGCE
jgi:micrococcal nuclease